MPPESQEEALDSTFTVNSAGVSAPSAEAPGMLSSKSAPLAILCVLLTLWLGLGLWAVMEAPFSSGTDESISYVAFTAAKNRWATEEDFHRFGIDFFYYPPLYFLAFAPFWGDDPAFVENYPQGESHDPNYEKAIGRRVIATDYLARVPPALERLYRTAKLVSLGLGLITLLALITTLRLLFSGPAGWWATLLGTAPVVLLPQFLYYHSLVNNDTLLNALGALACLAFVAAVRELERGDERRFFRLSFAVAVCVGLAFLTKMSAPVLLPLLPGLAWARFHADRGLPLKLRIRRSLGLLAGAAVVVFVCGGWWIAYKASLGDWNSFKAHRLAHPWGMANADNLIIPAWWLEQVLRIIRSYYGLFAGALVINVPDVVILAWLPVPAIAIACAIAAGFSWVWRAIRARTTRPAHGLRTVVWFTFAAVLALNIGSMMANLFVFLAPYGRLLFPSLVASHVLGAAVIARVLRPRAVAALSLLFVVHGAILLGMTLHYPMASSITQQPEDVRVLTGTDQVLAVGPVWSGPAEQPLWLPPGELTALRVKIDRSTLIPQVGATLVGMLTIQPPSGPPERIAVRRTALGDNDTSIRWAELELERSVHLQGMTPAFLSLRGTPPAWLPGFIRFSFACGRDGVPALFDGESFDCSLLLAGVYRSSFSASPSTSSGEISRRHLASPSQGVSR